ncbi:MAG: M48 family metalloprotease [Alphaproteobacteria bacterium]
MNYARTATLLSSAIAMALTVGVADIGAPWLQTFAVILVAAIAAGLVIEWQMADARLARHGLSGWPRLPNRTIVRNIAMRAGVPAPNLFLIESEAPNAFTSGRDRPVATIALTSGLLASLPEREIHGVLAHEIAHIVQRDGRYLTAIAILLGVGAGTVGAGAVAFGLVPDGGLVALPLALIVAMLAALGQMAVCRSREFGADRLGAKLCGNPLWIANALERIDSLDLGKSTPAPRTWALETYRFGPRRDRVLGLLSTHPPSSARIHRLRRLAGLSDPWE